jgi:hypothetical protein
VTATTTAIKAARPSSTGQKLKDFGGGASCAAVAAAEAAAVAAEAEAIEAGMLHVVSEAEAHTAARDCCVPRTLSEISGSTPADVVGVGAA